MVVGVTPCNGRKRLVRRGKRRSLGGRRKPETSATMRDSSNCSGKEKHEKRALAAAEIAWHVECLAKQGRVRDVRVATRTRGGRKRTPVQVGHRNNRVLLVRRDAARVKMMMCSRFKTDRGVQSR